MSIKDTLVRVGYTTKLKAKKHGPKIATVGGVVGLIGAGICR